MKKLKRGITDSFLATVVALPIGITWGGLWYLIAGISPENYSSIFTLFALSTLGLIAPAVFGDFAADDPFLERVSKKASSGLKGAGLLCIWGLISLFMGDFGRTSFFRLWSIDIYPNILLAIIFVITAELAARYRAREEFRWADVFFGAVLIGPFLGWLAKQAYVAAPITRQDFLTIPIGLPFILGFGFLFEAIGSTRKEKNQIALISEGMKWSKLVNNELFTLHMLLVGQGHSAPETLKAQEGFSDEGNVYYWMFDTTMLHADGTPFGRDRWAIGLAADGQGKKHFVLLGEDGKKYVSPDSNREIQGGLSREGLRHVITTMLVEKQNVAFKELVVGPAK